MYQWQNQHALPLVPGWILVPSDPWRWQEKLLCSVVTALPSKLCAAQCQSNVGSMCDCKPWGSSDLSVLVEILSESWYRSQKEWQCQLKVNIIPNRKKVMLTKDAPLSSHLAVSFCKLDNFFLFDLASLKIVLACSFYGVVKGSESIKSATAFLPMPSASIRSLAMPGLAGTPKDKKTVHCLQN